MPATAVPVIPPDLRELVLAQARTGLGPAAVLQPLLDAGWEREQALAAVESLLQEFVASLAREKDLPVPSKAPSPVGLNGPSLLRVGDREVQVLANLVHPRVVVFGQLLDGAECEGLIAVAADTLVRSSVVDGRTGGQEVHVARTSEGAALAHGATALVARIEARIAALTGWPTAHCEPLQVLRYGPGGEYRPHYDYFDPQQPGTATNLARGGQRVASLVMYLNTPEDGGATVFPEPRFEVAAVRGNAVFFSYDMPHPMTRTLHAGAPVIRGEKWIATCWFREGPAA